MIAPKTVLHNENTSGKTMVKFVESEGEWAELMEKSKSQLVVVDFTASWCPPCRMIAPHFDAMDKIAQRCGVRAMPTFQFYRGGEKADEMCGADVNGLRAKVAAMA